MEHEFFLPTATHNLLCMYHPPREKCRGGLLMCSPVFEERKTCQRPMVELARELADAGLAVLRFDYAGCGDSDGAFKDHSLDDWEDNIADAGSLLRQLCGQPIIGAFGIRSGASFASLAATRGIIDGPLILCNPVIKGAKYVREELRKKLMKEMITFGGSQSSREVLIKRLEANQTIDFDGYEFTARLYRDIMRLDLPATTHYEHQNPVLLIAINPNGDYAKDLKTLEDGLSNCGTNVDSVTCRIEPFWNRIGLVDTAPLRNVVTEWLDRQLPTASTTPPPSPAQVIGNVADGTRETPVSFPAASPAKVRAILHPPCSPRKPSHAIIFCHGWTGNRLGPHRMFVKAARRLSRQGALCMRIDFTGRGNSDGATGTGSIQQMISNTKAAINFIQKKYPDVPLYLLGICSGGKVAIGAACDEPRIRGLVLWSGEALGHLRHAATNRRKTMFALNEYFKKLKSPQTWKKIVSGRINVNGVKKTLTKHETRTAQEAAQEEKILTRFRFYNGAVLLIYGTHDPDTKMAGTNYQSYLKKNGITHEYHAVENANHSFYSLETESRVLDLSAKWFAENVPESNRTD